MSTDAKAPQFFHIPKGTPMACCRSCNQEVYWIKTAANKPMPVSVDFDGASCPTKTEDGSGISHFVDCPYANQYRRPR